MHRHPALSERSARTLNAIADYLLTFEDDFAGAEAQFRACPDRAHFAALLGAAERFNAEAQSQAVIAAAVTGVTVTWLSAEFAPLPVERCVDPRTLVWFRLIRPCLRLRGVARYGSWRLDDWRSQGFHEFSDLRA